jgi:hypothetical protein
MGSAADIATAAAAGGCGHAKRHDGERRSNAREEHMSTLIRPVARERDVDLIALGESCGYRVDDPNGRVGTVDGVVVGAWTDRPDAIEVRVGLFRHAILVVGVGDVASIDPVRRRVLLRESVDLADAYLP